MAPPARHLALLCTAIKAVWQTAPILRQWKTALLPASPTKPCTRADKLRMAHVKRNKRLAHAALAWKFELLLDNTLLAAHYLHQVFLKALLPGIKATGNAQVAGRSIMQALQTGLMDTKPGENQQTPADIQWVMVVLATLVVANIHSKHLSDGSPQAKPAKQARATGPLLLEAPPGTTSCADTASKDAAAPNSSSSLSTAIATTDQQKASTQLQLQHPGKAHAPAYHDMLFTAVDASGQDLIRASVDTKAESYLQVAECFLTAPWAFSAAHKTQTSTGKPGQCSEVHSSQENAAGVAGSKAAKASASTQTENGMLSGALPTTSISSSQSDSDRYQGFQAQHALLRPLFGLVVAELLVLQPRTAPALSRTLSALLQPIKASTPKETVVRDPRTAAVAEASSSAAWAAWACLYGALGNEVLPALANRGRQAEAAINRAQSMALEQVAGCVRFCPSTLTLWQHPDKSLLAFEAMIRATLSPALMAAETTAQPDDLSTDSRCLDLAMAVLQAAETDAKVAMGHSPLTQGSHEDTHEPGSSILCRSKSSALLSLLLSCVKRLQQGCSTSAQIQGLPVWYQTVLSLTLSAVGAAELGCRLAMVSAGPAPGDHADSSSSRSNSNSNRSSSSSQVDSQLCLAVDGMQRGPESSTTATTTSTYRPTVITSCGIMHPPKAGSSSSSRSKTTALSPSRAAAPPASSHHSSSRPSSAEAPPEETYGALVSYEEFCGCRMPSVLAACAKVCFAAAVGIVWPVQQLLGMVWQGLAPSSRSSERSMLQLEAAVAPPDRTTPVMSPELRYRHVRSLALGNPNSRSAAAWSEWPRDGGAVAQHIHRFWTEHPAGSTALSPPRVGPSCSSLSGTPRKLELGCSAAAAAGPLLALSSGSSSRGSSSTSTASAEKLEPGSTHSDCNNHLVAGSSSSGGAHTPEQRRQRKSASTPQPATYAGQTRDVCMQGQKPAWASLALSTESSRDDVSIGKDRSSRRSSRSSSRSVPAAPAAAGDLAPGAMWFVLVGRALHAAGTAMQLLSRQDCGPASLTDNQGTWVVATAGSMCVDSPEASPAAVLTRLLHLVDWVGQALPRLRVPQHSSLAAAGDAGHSKQLQPVLCDKLLPKLTRQLQELREDLESVAAMCGAGLGGDDCRRAWVTVLKTPTGCLLPQRLVSFSSLLCAALPTRYCCNEPSCCCFERTSELQLAAGKGSKCSGCGAARYCGSEHHHQHWQLHKAVCHAVAAARGRASKDT